MTGETYAGFVKSSDASAYARCEAVGAWTAPSLAEHPEAETRIHAVLQAEVFSAVVFRSSSRIRGPGPR